MFVVSVLVPSCNITASPQVFEVTEHGYFRRGLLSTARNVAHAQKVSSE